MSAAAGPAGVPHGTAAGAAPAAGARPRAVHRGPPAEDKVSTVNLTEIIERHPCAALVERLEECMGEHDRVWSRCQEEVRALRRCNAAHPPAGSGAAPAAADK
jgi:hypothetical protein